MGAGSSTQKVQTRGRSKSPRRSRSPAKQRKSKSPRRSRSRSKSPMKKQ
jgi:hypothetical protein